MYPPDKIPDGAHDWNIIRLKTTHVALAGQTIVCNIWLPFITFIFFSQMCSWAGKQFAWRFFKEQKYATLNVTTTCRIVRTSLAPSTLDGTFRLCVFVKRTIWQCWTNSLGSREYFRASKPEDSVLFLKEYYSCALRMLWNIYINPSV